MTRLTVRFIVVFLAAGNHKLLNRAIGNVVTNAFRFAASRVTVAMDREGQDAVIRFSDDGPGIPAADVERVFEPFVQLRDSRDGGTGLGLSIAKRIVEQHSGTIAFENIDSSGACCVITLPIAGQS